MQIAALLYNPASGGGRKRQKEVEAALAVLQQAGIKVHLVLTNSPSHAEDEARKAIAVGCDTVFACGGDGTIHNIMQVLAKTPVALGVLPLGTANALAHDLRLPMSVAAAAKALLNATPRRIPLGRVDYQESSGARGMRYFIVGRAQELTLTFFTSFTPTPSNVSASLPITPRHGIFGSPIGCRVFWWNMWRVVLEPRNAPRLQNC